LSGIAERRRRQVDDGATGALVVVVTLAWGLGVVGELATGRGSGVRATFGGDATSGVVA
jgi:hypothetical protein